MSSCYWLKWLVVMLVVMLPGVVHAQKVSAEVKVPTNTEMPPDTLPDIPEKTPYFSHRRLVVQYDSRYSIINNHFCTINGLKLGMEWRGRVRTGMAVYFLSTGIPTRQPLPDNAAHDVDAELRFRYLALYTEYVVLQNSRWSLSGNVQMGLGSVHVRYLNDSTNIYERTPNDFLGIIEPSAAAQMRLFRWASLGAGAGWRQAVLVAPTIRSELSGPVFYLRANILLGPLIKVAKGKARLFTQEGLRVRGLDSYTRDKFYGSKREEDYK